MEEKHYFKKIQSDYLLSHLFTFFNLSDIRTLFLLSKKFINILNKDNKKIIRDIQEKIFGSELNNELILKNLKINKYKITNYSINKSPIINSILADNYLISTSNKFDNGFIIHDLTNNKISQTFLFNDNIRYSYVSSLLYIKEKKIFFVGTDNGYIIGYIFIEKEKNFIYFWEYKTGLNKEIKKLIYYIIDNKVVLISLDSDDLIKINFVRIFYIKDSYNNENDNKYIINYMKSYIIKNYFVYNIKYFEGNKNNKFFALSLNEGYFLDDININLMNTFKFDKLKIKTIY